MLFLAGANSIFVGDTLLTAGNPGEDQDAALFRRLGIKAMRFKGIFPGLHPSRRHPAPRSKQAHCLGLKTR